MGEALLGVTGWLSVATRGDAGPGEVVLSINGATETYLAFSPEPLARQTRVVVVDNRGARSVDVLALDDQTTVNELDL